MTPPSPPPKTDSMRFLYIFHTKGRSILPSLLRAKSLGFSLVEILIALFVFLIGVLGVFAMFPVAIRSASKTITATRGQIVAHMALATLTYELRTPLYAGRVNAESMSDLELEAIPSTTWAPSEWLNHYVMIYKEADPTGRQTRRIQTNSSQVLTAYVAFNPKPKWSATEKWHYQILRYRLPPANNTNEKIGYVKQISDEAGTASDGQVIYQITKDRTGTNYQTDLVSANWTFGSVPYKYFVLFTTGKAAGLCLPVHTIYNQTPSDRIKVVAADANWKLTENAGVRSGDEFVIIGNDVQLPVTNERLISIPDNMFGIANQKQLLPDPSAPVPEEAEYSYTIIFSDTKTANNENLVRVDVLVYRNFDNVKDLAANKRAVAWLTSYVERDEWMR